MAWAIHGTSVNPSLRDEYMLYLVIVVLCHTAGAIHRSHSFCFTMVLVSLLQSLNFPERVPAFCFIIVVGWLLLLRWQGRIQDGLGALVKSPLQKLEML